MLFESFQQVLNDDRVSEIIIVDDCSPESTYRKIQVYTSGHEKIKLFRNRKNLGCYKNKREAISLATNEYVIIFDSDNIMTKGYIDKIFEQEWNENVILAPDYVVSFDYRHFAGLEINRRNVSKYVNMKQFDCLINTMNYFVHRDSYLKVWDGSIEPWTADTIYQNYRWIDSGRTFKVVKGLEYEHRIKHNFREEQSHYQTHVRMTGNLFNNLMNKLRRMS
jgi:glycosyltransferase involved in cell wall biosynthesis